MNQGEHLEDWVDYRERADLQVGYVKSEILNYLRENKAETQEAVEQEERLDMEALTSGSSKVNTTFQKKAADLRFSCS